MGRKRQNLKLKTTEAMKTSMGQYPGEKRQNSLFYGAFLLKILWSLNFMRGWETKEETVVKRLKW